MCKKQFEKPGRIKMLRGEEFVSEEGQSEGLQQLKDLMEEKKEEMKTVRRGKIKILNIFWLGLAKSFAQLDGLTCSICMDYIISCRTAVCGHSFCEECINESLIRKKECPHCRKDIRKLVLQKSEIIDNAVKMFL